MNKLPRYHITCPILGNSCQVMELLIAPGGYTTDSLQTALSPHQDVLMGNLFDADNSIHTLCHELIHPQWRKDGEKSRNRRRNMKRKRKRKMKRKREY